MQVVYQSVIQLAYADKLLTEVHIRFRDMYKNVLRDESLSIEGPKLFSAFTNHFARHVSAHFTLICQTL